jgi:cysteinyl-tRNA synthetase
VSEVLTRTRAIVLRYYLTAAHYRSTIEYQDGSLAEAEATVERLEGFLSRALPGVTTAVPTGEEELPEEFRASLDDDLGVSGALAVIHDTVRAGNTALDDGDVEEATRRARLVIAMTDILGVNPLDPAFADAGDDSHASMAALDVLVRDRMAARAAARAARDWSTADTIRDQLAAAGIVLEDTAAGARWSLSRPNPQD